MITDAVVLDVHVWMGMSSSGTPAGSFISKTYYMKIKISGFSKTTFLQLTNAT